MRKLFSIIALSVLFLSFNLLSGQAQASASREAIRQSVEQTISRLNLTEQQTSEIRPIMEKFHEERQKILEKYGLDRDSRKTGQKPDRETLRKLHSEISPLKKKVNEEIRHILTDEQMKTLEAIQKEMRQKVRSRRSS